MSHQLEIERRFLLKNDHWRTHASAPQTIQQGYISITKETTIRVRIINEQAWLTIKAHINDTTCHEFEYCIALSEAHLLLAHCTFKIEKLRYIVHYQGFDFEIDEFLDDNAPLIIAELELPNEHTPYPIAQWLGEEITSHPHYTNAYLSQHPYHSWHKQT